MLYRHPDPPEPAQPTFVRRDKPHSSSHLVSRNRTAASHSALEAFNDALRAEVAPHGVSVSLIQPGFVRGGRGTEREPESQASEGADGGDDAAEIEGEGGVQVGGRADKAAEALYPNVHGAGFASMWRSAAKNAEPPSTSTTPAITHALTAPYPRTRYPCSNWGPHGRHP